MRLLSVLAILSAGCTSPSQVAAPGPDDLDFSPGDDQPDASFTPVVDRAPNHRTGSSTLASTADGRLLNVNPDAGTITLTDPSTHEVREVFVGAEPSRIAVHGDTVFVTLRAERALATVSLRAFEAGVVRRVELGAEPLGLVLRGDGERAYVALSEADQVVEVGAEGLVPLRTFHVAGQPRTLAIDPWGQQVYIATGRSTEPLQRIDVQTGSMDRVPLPHTTLTPEIDLRPRITGDPTIVMDGDAARLAVPVVYLDTETPVTALSSLEEVVPEDPLDDVEGIDGGGIPTGSGGYGGGIGGEVDLDRMTTAIVEIPISAGGPLEQGEPIFAEVAEETNASLLRPVVSTISSLAATEDGAYYLAAVEASSAVLVVDRNPENTPTSLLTQTGGVPTGVQSHLLPAKGFVGRDLTAIDAGAGVNGVAQLDGRWFTNVPFDHEVREIDFGAAIANLNVSSIITHTDLVPPLDSWLVSDEVLPDDVALGRRLFYSAREGVMGGSGVSCSSCHVDGRDDGVVWTFDDGHRTTPSLAGRVSETEPVTWRSSVATVQDEAEITAVARLGGSDLTGVELDAIAAFIDWTRIPQRPAVQDSAAVQRGADLFQAAGCASCHTGDRHTDGQMHLIRGTLVDTPTLTGVSRSGPWLHDGSARSLIQVLDLARSGSMGALPNATDDDLRDLVAYLETL